MAMGLELYPPSVQNVPPNLTKASSQYRAMVVVVLISLLLFVLLYLGMVAASGWLLYTAVNYPMGVVNKLTILLKIGAIATAAMLFLFLLKGLFKRQQAGDAGYVQITEREHPELYAFIRRLCRETKAPYPHKIYVSPEVNAAVFYDTSLLNLILPVRKNLLIGLGLVNVLPMSEFKAVLAHEFGHFSQSSMALGSYVYIANRIIADMVYGRDSWDNLLETWRAQDFRISIFAWILSGVVWALRGILIGVFRLINLVESALSRQMEFHADLVAVSVTGSDSLIHALSRLELANDALGQAAEDLKTAAHHQMYSNDLFHHQTRAISYLRQVRRDPNLGEPPALPEDTSGRVKVFQAGVGETPSMYASHPPNWEREENAKRRYIRSVEDKRSPWLLFRNPEALREKVTAALYKEHWDMPPGAALTDAETVQAFIDEEHAETTYSPRYHGLYDDRFIEPGDVRVLAEAAKAAPWAPQQIGPAAARVYGRGLEKWMEGYTSRRGEEALLSGLDSGNLKLKGQVFEFRGQMHPQSAVKPLLAQVEAELEADRKRLSELDRDFFLAHYHMARTLGDRSDEELLYRYWFHLEAQEILKKLQYRRTWINAFLQHLSGAGNLSEQDIKETAKYLLEARTDLVDALNAAQQLSLPPLKNMQPGTPLRAALLSGEPVPDISASSTRIEGEWVGNLVGQITEAEEKVKRVHFKSLGCILALQERVAEDWRKRMTGAS